MKAIRGATTVAADTPQEIRTAVKEMLDAIASENSIGEENMIFLLFSNTEDVRSLYPAKAAREAGYTLPALFSAAEPAIEGSLPLCIRVMVLAETDAKPRHVYLRGAQNLRRDLKTFAIALDGPSGSGKSTIAKLLAKEYDILYLDTGAMYRACALEAAKKGVNPEDEKAVSGLMRGLDLRIEYRDGAQHTILDGEDVSEAIRRPEVSMNASKISALSCVREKMVQMQRKIASSMSCVLDGRDIGTAVLPDAQYKFFVTASVQVRAKRRFDELTAKGYEVNLSLLEKEMEQRDKNDSERKISPLKKAEDAVVIDTSGMSIDEVVRMIKKKIQERT